LSNEIITLPLAKKIAATATEEWRDLYFLGKASYASMLQPRHDDHELLKKVNPIILVSLRGSGHDMNEAHVRRCAKLMMYWAFHLGIKNPFAYGVAAYLHDAGKPFMGEEEGKEGDRTKELIALGIMAQLNKIPKRDPRIEIFRQHIAKRSVYKAFEEKMGLQFSKLPDEVRFATTAHHLRYKDDGTSYGFFTEHGLTIGEHQIADMMAIVDIFEAITGSRPYNADDSGDKRSQDATMIILIQMGRAGLLNLDLVFKFRAFLQDINESSMNLYEILALAQVA